MVLFGRTIRKVKAEFVSFSAQEQEPRFSQPIRHILTMITVLVVVGAVGYLLAPTVWPVFEASPYLNGFILLVFVVGIAACFWQVLTLITSVSWIEGFAMDRPGHEFVKAPRLLAPLASLLRDTRARRALTTSSTRSILDSVAQRLDEARDITRYIVNLLIFLGLLGTFYGLATTVPAVVDTIRSMAPEEGSDQSINFSQLMTGLENQLGGMGTAFASSLLGLAGSLVVGMLELFAGHGQNRFYTELEEWLSSITRIGLSSSDGDRMGSDHAAAAGIVDSVALQIETLKDVVLRAEENRSDMDRKLGSMADAISGLTRQLSDGMGGAQTGSSSIDEALVTRMVESQERLANVMSNQSEDAGQLDAETRMRLRNIDVQLLRILEEMSAGRQDSVAELRTELAAIAAALQGRAGG